MPPYDSALAHPYSAPIQFATQRIATLVREDPSMYVRAGGSRSGVFTVARACLALEW
jgi:hypothetical protein